MRSARSIRASHRFVDNYSELGDAVQARQLAAQHAKAQEAAVFARTNKMTYKNGMISTLASLKKRAKPTSADDTGTLEDDARKAKERAEKAKGKLTPSRLLKYIADKEKLAKYDYVIEIPGGPGGDEPTEEGNKRTCSRCAREYVVKAELEEVCPYSFAVTQFAVLNDRSRRRRRHVRTTLGA